ncbi:MAG: hypothetical protein Q4G68_06550 [Planctomycetia bacterium]|nr:hypothetical protein [Planctomycetia bacterium]
MTKKKKYLIFAGILIANLLVIGLVKNWGYIHDTWLFPKLYTLPSKPEVEKEAAMIAKMLTEGNVEYVLDKNDPNASLYFVFEVANWVDEAEKQKMNRKLEKDLANLKECIVENCMFLSHNNHNLVMLELSYDNGDKRKGSFEVYKNKQGVLGTTSFYVDKPNKPQSHTLSEGASNGTKTAQ